MSLSPVVQRNVRALCVKLSEEKGGGNLHYCNVQISAYCTALAFKPRRPQIQWDTRWSKIDWSQNKSRYDLRENHVHVDAINAGLPYEKPTNR